MESRTQEPTSLAATGVAGLDDVLRGGLPRRRLYLLEGDPGAGKTTLAMQFLMEGAHRGEAGLYVTLSETKEELLAVAASHGFSLDGIQICELITMEEAIRAQAENTIFHPAEIELGQLTRAVLDEVERSHPRRLAFDSLSEMRLLAQSPLRYRRQILALKQFFSGRDCTMLFLDDRTGPVGDLQVHSIAHGVIALEHLAPSYGAERRRLRITKLRGSAYRGGYHDFRIRTGGLDVYPRLVAAEHQGETRVERLHTGDDALDGLLGGGLDWGTSTLLLGPAGTGKSTMATRVALAAIAQGHKAAYFAFDESVTTLRLRSAGVGLSLEEVIASEKLHLQQVDPAEMPPGEFAVCVRGAVERGARTVVIDSLNGYMHAMPEERFLTIQLHELLTYLGQKGVLTILIVGQQGFMGAGLVTPFDASYLADTVILFRFYEAEGSLRQALSVVKKRRGTHEKGIRELSIGPTGITIGPELSLYRGVFTGVPVPLRKNGHETELAKPGTGTPHA
ncbi:MAG TPA: ATPase domain-containing protein [Candidatus Polarisedimenticolaceae bacterium]|nr:ATPase domain-containing protein [Candidatus Polarisedimenticolaceae bacterium]